MVGTGKIRGEEDEQQQQRDGQQDGPPWQCGVACQDRPDHLPGAAPGAPPQQQGDTSQDNGACNECLDESQQTAQQDVLSLAASGLGQVSATVLQTRVVAHLGAIGPFNGFLGEQVRRKRCRIGLFHLCPDRTQCDIQSTKHINGIMGFLAVAVAVQR